MKHAYLIITLFLFAGFFNTPAHAASSKAYSYIQLAQANQQSLKAATQSIKQQTGGRILSAKTVTLQGQRVHKIKVLLPSGKVQVFNVNAR